MPYGDNGGIPFNNVSGVSSSGSLTLTLGSIVSTRPGSLIVVFVLNNHNTTCPTPSDSVNSYTQVGSTVTASGPAVPAVACFVAQNALTSPGSLSITVSQSSSAANLYAIAMEWPAGYTIASISDGTNSGGTATGTGTNTSGTVTGVTPANPNDLLLTAMLLSGAFSGSLAAAGGTAYTNNAQPLQTTHGGYTFAACPGTSTQTPTFSWSTSRTWTQLTVALLPSLVTWQQGSHARRLVYPRSARPLMRSRSVEAPATSPQIISVHGSGGQNVTPIDGNDTITVTGVNLQNATQIGTFGWIATSFISNTSTQIVFTSPKPGSNNLYSNLINLAIDLRVTTPSGQSATNAPSDQLWLYGWPKERLPRRYPGSFHRLKKPPGRIQLSPQQGGVVPAMRRQPRPVSALRARRRLDVSMHGSHQAPIPALGHRQNRPLSAPAKARRDIPPQPTTPLVPNFLLWARALPRRILAFRPARSAEIIQPQFNPPFVPIPKAQPRRAVEPRPGHSAEVIRPQVNPPFVFQPRSLPKRAFGWRVRSAEVPTVQQPPPDGRRKPAGVLRPRRSLLPPSAPQEAPVAQQRPSRRSMARRRPQAPQLITRQILPPTLVPARPGRIQRAWGFVRRRLPFVPTKPVPEGPVLPPFIPALRHISFVAPVRLALFVPALRITPFAAVLDETGDVVTPITDPPNYAMSVLEALNLSWDTTNLLASGDVPTAPVVEVTDVLGDGTPITLAAGPTISGNLIVQRVDGTGDLKADTGNYLVRVTFVASPSNNKWTMETTLNVGP